MKTSRLPLLLLAMLAPSCAREKPAGNDGAAPKTSEAIVPVPTEAPAGEYRLDKSHASLVFRVDHITYSTYTASFDDFDATLAFDPKAPENMTVAATIDVGSLDLPAPPEGFLDTIKGADWLNAVAFPTMNFRSTAIELTAPNAARVAGDLTLHGVTAPVEMDVVFNGGYAGFPPYDPNARIGFSAKGSLKRSLFGVVLGVPNEENPVGVGDEVSFGIEAEFIGPPAPQ